MAACTSTLQKKDRRKETNEGGRKHENKIMKEGKQKKEKQAYIKAGNER
jgi:hypothetical protein